MPINPNVQAQPNADPNIGRPEETAEMRVVANEMNTLVEGGVSMPLAANMAETKVQISALTQKVAELESSLNESQNKLRNSRRLNKVMGGIAVAAAAVAVLNPFGNDSKETTRTAAAPVAAKTAEANKTVESNDIFGKLGKAFKVKEAEAKTAPASAAKTTENKLQDRIEHADKATSVAFTVKRANPTNSNVKEMIKELADGKNVKKADNQRDAWGSLDNAISLKKVTSAGAALGVALNAEANKGVAIGTANILNHKEATAPSNMTKEQAMRSVVEDLTKKGTKFERTVISGTENHGFNGKNVYSAGISENIPVLKVTVDGKAEYFKLVCLNGQNQLVRVPNPKETPTTDNPAPKKRTPITSIIETPDKNPKEKPSDKPEDKPKEEKPKEEQPPVKTPPKKDTNTTPGGVPGQNHGDPAGTVIPERPQAGDAGPGVVHQEQQTTPPPLPNNPAPTVPAETGPATTAPQEEANGSDTPAPTTDPNPQG